MAKDDSRNHGNILETVPDTLTAKLRQNWHVEYLNGIH